MSRQKHYYGFDHLHSITRSTYRRARLFDSKRFKRQWVRTLDELRSELNFKQVDEKRFDAVILSGAKNLVG